MAAKPDRIILDTNIWISFLLTKNYSKLDIILNEKQAILLFSKELVEEFLEVSNRPKLRRFFTAKDIDSILLNINDYAEYIVVTSVVSICRDAKDNFLLALAKDGNATHLITGDKDILDIKKVGRAKILTITEYLKG
jgi:uncharacterized protein